MEVKFSKKFKKQWKKIPLKIQASFNKRLAIFLNNPNHPLLRNHLLLGNFLGQKSINITGDIRAVYQESKDGQKIIFLTIGSHSELYE